MKPYQEAYVIGRYGNCRGVRYRDREGGDFNTGGGEVLITAGITV